MRIHNRPFEFSCSKCGATGLLKTRKDRTLLVEIIGKSKLMVCCMCGHQMSGEGWYVIKDEFGEDGCVPYTLIEPVEEGE